jgi:hypothetical protein
MKNLFFVLGMILLMTSCGHDAPLIQSMPEPDILTRALVTTSNGSPTSNVYSYEFLRLPYEELAM